eukprot:GHUV01043673.1.p1 GENE.GHUV01043673.1~~GHUV01043673.1.p1  ORF type:complete len:423 (+),score=82.42 GHUV01043673.1:253-1521(+)
MFHCLLVLHRCLCYPAVLYKVIEKASTANFDVLHILRDCSQKHNARTDWAMRPKTTCPNLALNATRLDIAMQFGDTVLLDSAQGKPQWAWSHMLQGGDMMASPMVHELPTQRVLGLSCVQLLLVILISMAPVYLAMHKLVLMQFSSVYRELSKMQQLVTCQHGVYAVVFSLQLVPQTVIACRFLFKAWTGDYIASQELPLLVGVFILSRAALYLTEACVRSVHTSWLLLVHHQLFFTIILMGLWTENTAVLSIGVVLDLFACHEAPLYVVLVSYRLKLNVTFSKLMLYTSCIWYVLTRVFQTVVLVYMIVCWATNPSVKLTPGFIITSMLCGAFTVIQAYTLVIYRAMGRKILSRGKGQLSGILIDGQPSSETSFSGKCPSNDPAKSPLQRGQSGDLQGMPDAAVSIHDGADMLYMTGVGKP